MLLAYNLVTVCLGDAKIRLFFFSQAKSGGELCKAIATQTYELARRESAATLSWFWGTSAARGFNSGPSSIAAS